MKPRIPNNVQGGFALIVVLFLITIMLLVGLSMVSITQIESGATQYDMRLGMARDNARYSLDLAVAELQQLVGIDQAVTAMADGYRNNLLDPDLKGDPSPSANGGVLEPFWTGVWDNDPSTATSAVWLVTRSVSTDFNTDAGQVDADPLSALPSGVPSVTLVGSGTAVHGTPASQTGFDVTVPLEVLQTNAVLGANGATTTVGRYGYWVGDLGVKASYALTNDANFVVYAPYDILNVRDRLGQMSGNVYPFETDPNFSLWDISTIANQARFPNLVTDSQIRQDGGAFLIQNATLDQIQTYFHDYTLMNRSVLADTFAGGLRVDLSAAKPNGGYGDTEMDGHLAPYANASNATYMVASPSGLKREYSIQALSSASNRPGISPVIVGFRINFGFTVNRSTGRVEVRPNVGVELWNPYSSALQLEDLQLTVTGLPTITFDYTTGTTTSDEYSADLNVVMGQNAFTVKMTSFPGPRMRAGQIATFTGGSDLNWGVGYTGNGDLGTYPIENTGGISVPDFLDTDSSDEMDDWFRLKVVTPVTPNVELRKVNGDLVFSTKLEVTEGDPWYDQTGETIGLFWDATARRFGYAWELRDPAVSESYWTSFDPRSGEISKDMVIAAEFNPTSDYSLLDQFDVSSSASGVFSHNPSYSVTGQLSTVAVQYDLPIFELGRQDMLSVSNLADAYFSSGIRWNLGRAGTAGSINRYFDRCFFSSVPSSSGSGWTVGSPLPNTRIEPLPGTLLGDLQSSDSAEHLLLRGAFNLNSTSIDAWKLVLKGIELASWESVFGTQVLAPVAPLESFQFLRFSQSAEETWLGFHEGGDDAQLTEQKGFRSTLFNLSEAEVDALATSVVSQIRIKINADGPFTSIAEFLDAGVLDNAIASVATLNDDGVKSYAPGQLNQIAIMNAIGSFLVARSDTFLIRAYGDAVNPFNPSEVWARAYCEAVVQRMPTKHSSDPNAGINEMSATGTAPGQFGREMRIISFRWLQPSEI